IPFGLLRRGDKVVTPASWSFDAHLQSACWLAKRRFGLLPPEPVLAGVCQLTALSRSRLGMDACVDREELWVRLIRGRSRKHLNGRTRSAPVEAWAGAWERTALLERAPAPFFLCFAFSGGRSSGVRGSWQGRGVSIRFLRNARTYRRRCRRLRQVRLRLRERT